MLILKMFSEKIEKIQTLKDLCTNDYISNLLHFHIYFRSMLSILLT
jgi:hypothetical protein